jgi:hypothetical protein
MTNITRLPRKPRPLQKIYQPEAPYVVERMDQEDGSITYDVFDERPDSYRFVCAVSDYAGQNGFAKHDAEQIARGLNFLLQCGKETLPSVKDRDD